MDKDPCFSVEGLLLGFRQNQNPIEISIPFPTISRGVSPFYDRDKLIALMFPAVHALKYAEMQRLLESGFRKEVSRTQFRGLSGIITPFSLKKSWRSTDSHLKIS